MARRRGGTARFACQEGGCSEVGLFDYANRGDADRLYRTYDGRFRCLRHSHKERWLSPQITSKRVALTVEQRSYGKFWSGIENGWAHGPGFMAMAEEFPPGTVLEITASIVLPPHGAPDSAGDGQGGWQPIETAPKDDLAEILAWIPHDGGGHVEIASYDADLGSWWGNEGLRANPSHWMPLPAPPQPGTARGRSRALL